MNEQFWDFLGLREDPFHVCPNPRFYCSTPAHDAALAALMFGIESRQGLLLLTGDVGTGKTTILKKILEWRRERGYSTAFLFHTRVELIGLLRLILAAFGLPCESNSRSCLLRTLDDWLLRRHGANDLPVLILDEAQALPPQTLDGIRLILNTATQPGKLLQILLSGQPELEEKLQLPELQQLRQRIMSHSRLAALTENETDLYISRRLELAGGTDTSAFSKEAIHSIHVLSQGIPRVVNLLCEYALISAYGAQRRVIGPELIQRIAQEFDLPSCPSVATGNERQSWHPHGPSLFPKVLKDQPTAFVEREAAPMLVRVAAIAVPCIAAAPTAAPLAVPVPPSANPPATRVLVTPVVADRRTPELLAQPRKYWRRYLSRSAVGVFGRNSVLTVKQGWRAVGGILVEFDVLEELRPRMAHVQAQISVKEEAARAAVARVWRKLRSRSTMVVDAGNTVSSFRRVWASASEPIIEYVRSVADSFVRDCRICVRDCRMLFRESKVSIAVTTTVDGNKREPRSTAHRNVAVFHWLRQPMDPRKVLRSERRRSP